jgi:hypothetical protein
VDGRTVSKWLNKNVDKPVVFDFGRATEVSGYRLATGFDAHGRDPLWWTLEGTNHINGPWKLLHEADETEVFVPQKRMTWTSTKVQGTRKPRFAEQHARTDGNDTEYNTAKKGTFYVGDSVDDEDEESGESRSQTTEPANPTANKKRPAKQTREQKKLAKLLKRLKKQTRANKGGSASEGAGDVDAGEL